MTYKVISKLYSFRFVYFFYVSERQRLGIAGLNERPCGVMVPNSTAAEVTNSLDRSK